MKIKLSILSAHLLMVSILVGCCKDDDGIDALQVGHWDLTIVKGYFDGMLLFSSDTSTFQLRLDNNRTGERFNTSLNYEITNWHIVDEDTTITFEYEFHNSFGETIELTEYFYIIVSEDNKQVWERMYKTYLPTTGKVYDTIETWYLEREE